MRERAGSPHTQLHTHSVPADNKSCDSRGASENQCQWLPFDGMHVAFSVVHKDLGSEVKSSWVPF
jgi:hypothetical protein